jgi:HEPN domain-containing protein
LGLLSQKIEIPDELFDNASELEDFAVDIRYPETTVELSDEEIQQAFKVAKLIRSFVITQTDLTIDYEDVIRE